MKKLALLLVLTFVLSLSCAFATDEAHLLIDPNNKDGITNVNITLNNPVNAPPWYKELLKNIPYKPCETLWPSIK